MQVDTVSDTEWVKPNEIYDSLKRTNKNFT